jgi:3-oxoacyl-[acyl-carrier protein] reductase
MATRSFRRVIVTGAASGIGRAFAAALVAEGSAVGLIDIAADPLRATALELGADDPTARTAVADVSDRNAVDAGIATLASELGGVDLLIHCAAALFPGRFLEQPAERFEKAIAVDLLGTANIVRATASHVVSSRGAVVCVASTAAVHGWPAMSAYSAAKCGVSGFCDAIRAELRASGVLVTTVYPLLIATPLLSGADVAPILAAGKAIPPEAVVRKTLAGVRRGRTRIYVPSSVRWIAAVHGIAPFLLDWYGRQHGLR